jgi:hypothetical protein
MMAPKSIWIGRILSGLVVAFLLLDASMKLIPAQFVLDASAQIGWPPDLGTARMLGAILLTATALYIVPRTSVLGAILVTGFLGGAVASHVRIGSPVFTHDLFGAYLGVIVWGGLWFREPNLRALIPLRIKQQNGA